MPVRFLRQLNDEVYRSGPSGLASRLAVTRQRAATLADKVEQQVKMVVNGVTDDPTALVFVLIALIFTISETIAGPDHDLLSEVIARLKSNDFTKSFGIFL